MTDELAGTAGSPQHSRVELETGSVQLLSWGSDRWADVPPILLLHEGLGSASSWGRFAPQLAESTGRRVLAVSRYGYGHSSPRTAWHDDFLHHEAHRVLPELIDSLTLRRVILVGHSDGASIALLHAERPTAKRVEATVLIAPHVIVEPITRAAIAALQDHPDRLASWLERHHLDGRLLFESWTRVWLSESFESWDIRSSARALGSPTLLIQGRNDEFGTLRQLDLIDENAPIPTPRVVLEGCGHVPPAQRRGATVQSIARFLERSL